MKFLFIIINNAKKIMFQNKSTFIIITFSLTVTTFGILFYSGFILHNYSERQINQTGSTIKIWTHNKTDIDTLKNIIDDIEINDNLLQKILISQKPIEELKDSLAIVGEYNNIHSKRITKGRYFLQDESEAVLILPEDQVENVIGFDRSPLNQIVEIGDYSFKIVGIASFFYIDYIAVPINYYINHLPTEYIEIAYYKKLNPKEKSLIYSRLDKFTCIKDISISESKSMILTLSFWLEFSQVLLIFLISIISMLSIIIFWVKQYKRTYNIYSICGSSRITTLFLITGQMYIIILGSVLTGSVLYCFMKTFFIKNKLAEFGNHLFYISICIFVLLITFGFTFFTVRKANKKNNIYIISE